MIATAPAGAGTSRWQWQRLLEAPHRVGFFAGVLMFAASAAWWAAVLSLPALGIGVPWQVPHGLAHGLLMSGGFVPMFLAGFLFTAGPRWLQVPAVPARDLRWPVLLHLSGWLLFMLGVHLRTALAALGLALAAVAWAAVSVRFGGLLRRSRVGDRLHPRLLLAACATGAVLMLAAAAALAAMRFDLARAALHAGLWAGDALAFVAAIHRMLPFFGDEPKAPWPAHGPLWLLVAALILQALVGAAEVMGPPMLLALMSLQAIGEAVVASMLLTLAWRSWRWPSTGLRLVAMLHVGFVWLGLAFAFGAASHASRAWNGHAAGGLASLHALGAGFMGSSLFAMVARVTAGHGGRAVVADTWLWRLFWVLQLAIVGRVAAAVGPAGLSPLITVSAIAWAMAAIAWSVRHGLSYGQAPGPQPRPERGRPRVG